MPKRIAARLTITLYEDGTYATTEDRVVADTLADFQQVLDDRGESILGPFYTRKDGGPSIYDEDYDVREGVLGLVGKED